MKNNNFIKKIDKIHSRIDHLSIARAADPFHVVKILMKTPVPETKPVEYYLNVSVNTVLHASLLVRVREPLCKRMI